MHGVLHDLFSAPVFLALPAACFLSARRFGAEGRQVWSAYCAASGLTFTASFALAGMGLFNQVEGLTEHAGALQRMALITGFSWMSVLATIVHRNS